MIHRVGQRRHPWPAAAALTGLWLILLAVFVPAPNSALARRVEAAAVQQINGFGRAPVSGIVCVPVAPPLATSHRFQQNHATATWRTWTGETVEAVYRHSRPRVDLQQSPYGDARWNPITDDIDWAPFAAPGLGYYTGTLHQVDTAGELTTALANCADTDIIEFIGPVSTNTTFTCRARGDVGWVLFRTDDTAWLTSTASDRVALADASHMHALTCTGTASFFRPAQGARGYDLRGIDFTKTQSTAAGNNPAGGFIQWIASTQNQTSHQGTYLNVDKCLFRNPHTSGAESFSRRGIFLSGENAIITRSLFLRFCEGGADSQAIAFTNGVGKYKVADNGCEACSEIIYPGGAVQAMGAAATMADVLIQGNYLFRSSDMYLASVLGTQKNMGEMKHGRRWTWDSLLCDGFAGTGQQFDWNFGSKPQNASEQAWVRVEDVLLRYVKCLNSAGAIQILNAAADGGWHSGIDGTRRVQVKHLLQDQNTFNNSSNKIQIGAGCLTGVRELNDVTIENVTTQSKTSAWIAFGMPAANAPQTMRRLTLLNSINAGSLSFGPIIGNGAVGSNSTALNTVAPSTPDWTCKVMIEFNRAWDATLANSPNLCVNAGSLAAIDFVNAAGGDYTLAGASPYKATGTDGNDPGAYIAGLNSRLSGITS